MRSFFNQRIVAPIIKLLKQGASPGQLALAMTFGVILAIVPVFGSSTVLCLSAIALLRLNPVAVLMVNQFAYPLQFICYLPFIRAGEWLFGAEKLPFSISQIFEMFSTNVYEAIGQLWWSTMYALVAWVLISVPLMLVLFYVLKEVLKRIMERNTIS